MNESISNSLKTICGSLFAHCDEKEARPLAEPLLEELRQAEGSDRFVLADALYKLAGELSIEAILKGSLAAGTVPEVRLEALSAPRFDLAPAAEEAPVPPFAMGTGVAIPEWNNR